MIYVDAIIDHGWRLGPSCHLFTDVGPLDELHSFAARIGMRRIWFQHRPGSMPHYDLVVSRRVRALKLGAVELDRNQTVERLRAWRALTPDRCPLPPEP